MRGYPEYGPGAYQNKVEKPVITFVDEVAAVAVDWKEHAHFLSKELERSQYNLKLAREANEDNERRLFETELELKYVRRDRDAIEDELVEANTNFDTLRTEYEECLANLEDTQDALDRATEANQSVSVCDKHTEEIKVMSGLANGCWVCEANQLMEQRDHADGLISHVMNYLGENS